MTIDIDRKFVDQAKTFAASIVAFGAKYGEGNDEDQRATTVTMLAAVMTYGLLDLTDGDKADAEDQLISLARMAKVGIDFFGNPEEASHEDE